MISKKLVAAIACRNNGSRLYGKPLQNLDVSNQVTILDNIIGCLNLDITLNSSLDKFAILSSEFP